MTIWSSSRIDIIQDCKRRYYYQYIVHEKEKTIIPEFISGRILHSAADSTRIKKRSTLFKYDDEEHPIIRYKSPESFGNTLRARWLHQTRGKYQDKEISWRYDTQRFVMAHDIRKMGEGIYKYFSKKGTAIESELGFKINVNNIWFSGGIDEIRENHTINRP